MRTTGMPTSTAADSFNVTPGLVAFMCIDAHSYRDDRYLTVTPDQPPGFELEPWETDGRRQLARHSQQEPLGESTGHPISETLIRPGQWIEQNFELDHRSGSRHFDPELADLGELAQDSFDRAGEHVHSAHHD